MACSGTSGDTDGWQSTQVRALALPSIIERIVWQAAHVSPRSWWTSGSIFRNGSPAAAGPR